MSTATRIRHGFTLIELLVVVAIISILAATMYPVFAQAREKSRQSTCTSNMRSLGLAVMLYAQDYDATYPPIWYPVNDGQWPNTVRPYMGQASLGGKFHTQGIMVCPSAPYRHPGWSYGMSQEMNVYDRKLNSYRGVPLAAIARPAGVMMLAEAPQVREWGACIWQIETDPDCWGGPLGNGIDVKGYLDEDGISRDTLANCSMALPRYRHNGGCVIAWADGHASWRRKGSLRWCRDISAKEPGPECPP